MIKILNVYKIPHKNLTMLLVASTLCSVIFAVAGLTIVRNSDRQAQAYNIAVAAYQSGDDESAVKLYELSLNVYEQARHESGISLFIHGQPDRELAALAAFQLGALRARKEGMIREAAGAFAYSLDLNPGNQLSSDVSQRERLMRIALHAKYNLEILLRAKPELTLPGDKPGNGSLQESPGNSKTESREGI